MKPIVIDLSHWNTVPSSLEEAARSGIVGVIHKASEGTGTVDSKAEARASLARDAGLAFGLYHFIRPGNVSGQVDNFLSVVSRLGTDRTLLALDYEDSVVTLSECEQWLKQVEAKTQTRPVIYSGHVLKEMLKGQRHGVLNEDNYKLWLAQYASEAVLPIGWSKYWLWQYTDKGTVPGVEPPTDLNAGDVNEVLAYWGKVEPRPELVQGGGIGDAVRWMHSGLRVARRGWNGKNMWIALQVPDEGSKMTLPYVYMRTVQGDLVPWLCSQTDLLATDWITV